MNKKTRILERILTWLFPNAMSEIINHHTSISQIVHEYGSVEAYHQHLEDLQRFCEEEAQRLEDEQSYYNDMVDYDESLTPDDADWYIQPDYPEEPNNQDIININPRYDYTKMKIGSQIHLNSLKGTYIVTEMFDKGFKIKGYDKLFAYSDFKMYAGKHWHIHLNNN